MALLDSIVLLTRLNSLGGASDTRTVEMQGKGSFLATRAVKTQALFRHEGGFSHRSGIPQVRLGGLAVLGLAPQDRWRVRSGACCRYRVVPVDPAVKEERIVRLLCLCQHHFLRKTVDSL